MTDQTHPVAVTKEGIQLCLANSERLLRDAERVSEPTCVALTELAIEESAKGWMLFFTLWSAKMKNPSGGPIWDFARSTLERGASEIKPKDLEPIVDYIKKHTNDFTNPPLDEAFEHHRVKLDFIDAIVGYLTVILPLIERVQLPPPLIERAILGPRKPSRTPVSEKVAKIRAALEGFHSQSMKDISGLKEAGFYVDVDIDGSLIAPMGRLFKTEALEEVATYLNAGLKGITRLA